MTRRLSKVAREFNVGVSTIIEYLDKKGIKIDDSPNPNSKITEDIYNILVKEYSSELKVKKESEKLDIRKTREKKETISIDDQVEEKEDLESDSDFDSDEEDKELMISANVTEETPKVKGPVILGKIDLEATKKPANKKKEEPVKEPEPEVTQEETPEIVEEIEETQEIPQEIEEETSPEEITKEISTVENDIKVVGKIDLDSLNQKTRPAKKTRKEREQEQRNKKEAAKPITVKQEIPEPPVEKAEGDRPGQKDEAFLETKIEKLSGPTVIGKIDLSLNQRKDRDKDGNKKLVASSDEAKSGELSEENRKKKRKRIRKDKSRAVDVTEKKPTPVAETDSSSNRKKKKKGRKVEVSVEEVQQQIKETLARLTTKTKSKGAKYRREKRDAVTQKMFEEQEKVEAEKSVLKVAEFVSVSELATMMNVSVNEVITTCMNIGMFVSINQRLDAETLKFVADEFGFSITFTNDDLDELIKVDEDAEEDIEFRSPIVTVMGHVDHGKTKLLDFIRHTNVVAGEAGGITQHIGAYSVALKNGKTITFLDTPGHEAFTAMRARGAQITDIAIIVIAADDNVMPQTIEAINHAQAANVPIVFAINKIDKPNSNPEKIKEQLSKMNILVEDWGGKYQSQEIAAKPGTNVDLLLEKVLLEAELLDLKANPNKKAIGTIIESSLDKGRGYVATLLVESGTLRVGDIMLAGTHTGHVKAMFNERGQVLDIAGPSTPVRILGLNGAPQAGDKFNIMDNDKEAKEIANKRIQLQREQGLRTHKHITLDEIGRRIAIGNFQELNVVVKGDVDGSIEALSDSLIKLSTEEIQVNVIHKAVGQITEMDVMLASASNAIIVGFQVRPSLGARKLAEKEEIEIRLYSIIYDAINEIRDAMEGMLSPEVKEEITATVEVRETFKITKVGTVAGCFVRDGKITRNTKVRIIRDGIVIYSGDLGSLKRFKDDVKEVSHGYECGLNINNFNDIKIGDIIEGYEQVEIKKKL
ncbi:MAG: translation initiation factor IF-2 [Bacteroidales bacterium]|nr:translation initiation factor IF-2 [Bacteroidales bacterium]